jgi:DNA-binding MarR family transcriptional regulator
LLRVKKRSPAADSGTDTAQLLQALQQRWGDPERHVGYLLKSLMHGLRQITEAALRDADLDVSMAQLVTLGAIATEPGLPGAQLAKRLLITAQSMNVVLKALQQQGLVNRDAHPHNQRAHRWFITAAGLQLLERSMEVCEPVFEQMQSRLDATERQQLIHLLNRCIEGLDTSGPHG